jgi:phosphoribosylformylglycinamidine cyclo-ligase
MVLAVAEEDVKTVTQAIEDAGETIFRIGRVEPGPRGCTVAGASGAWSGRTAWTATHDC